MQDMCWELPGYGEVQFPVSTIHPKMCERISGTVFTVGIEVCLPSNLEEGRTPVLYKVLHFLSTQSIPTSH